MVLKQFGIKLRPFLQYIAVPVEGEGTARARAKKVRPSEKEATREHGAWHINKNEVCNTTVTPL
jgi:hypothetical protein